LTGLVEQVGQPIGRCTDSDGVHHRLWRVNQPGLVTTIAEAVASAPVVIADGHHRYETSRNYRDERNEGGQLTDGDRYVMAYIVELAPSELFVGSIHRIVTPPSPDVDLTELFARWFELQEVETAEPGPASLAADSGSPVISFGTKTFVAKPTDTAKAAAEQPCDSAYLDCALQDLDLEVTYEHKLETTLKAVANGSIGVIVNPPSVDLISSVANAAGRFPPKSTYFFPKPATGLVFRSLDQD
jgi:uncharacterized protein (DUF1015 family)